MSLDEPVAPDEATLQRYFDGTLSPDEAEAFEHRLEADAALAARAASYASLFAALELHGVSDRPDLAAAVVERWAASVDPNAAVRLFLGVDAVLGVLLVAWLGLNGPTQVATSWFVGLKDVALAAHAMVSGPEQGVILALAAVGLSTAAIGAVGLGLGRAFLGAGSAA